MRILVADDDRAVRDSLRRSLAFNGYQVELAADGQQALDAMSGENGQRPDALVLDVMMPRVDGLEVCRRLRNAGDDIPVLVLTAREAVSDRVAGLDAGADDYLAKPFDYDELLARVKALLRRASIRAGETMMRVGDLAIDPISREVTRAGRKVALTQKEYALLEYLMRHAGIPVTREQISEQVWKQPFDPTTNIVDVYINYLRKKLETDGGTPLVHTVRGVGYVLRETPTPDS